MSNGAPRIDTRTAVEVKARLVDLLEGYTAHPAAPAQAYPFKPWQEYDPATREPTGTSAALVGVFARFAEIVIERLNQVPDKNLLAFLDLLGAARQPPQPARVPITFTLTAGSAANAQVPQGTQVAAPPPPGAKDPVVFETERPLSVNAALLTSLVTLDPEQDSYGDWSERIVEPSPFPVFKGDHAFEHMLYLGDAQLLGYPRIASLTLSLTLTVRLGEDADPRKVSWEYWDSTLWQPLTPTEDSTNGLTKSGKLDFGPVPAMPESAVNGRSSRWLRCRLITPITQSPVALAGMVRAVQLPEIQAIVAQVGLEREGLAPDLGYVNGAPLDMSKAFFPFGDKPKRYDTLFLASSEAFSKERATIQLQVVLANPQSNDPESVLPSNNLQLAWECWNGSTWQVLGRSGLASDNNSDDDLSDGTAGFSKSGTVELKLPDAVPAVGVNGQDNHWLRVHIVQGNYGTEASYELIDPDHPENGYLLIPATFRPPVIEKITIGYELTPKRAPEVCFSHNQHAFQDCTAAAAGAAPPFAPFHASAEVESPGLYLGFELPPGRAAFSSTTISLYNRVAASKYGERAIPLAPETSTRVGAAGTPLTHSFTITNTGAQDENFDVTLLGHQWPSVAPASVTVAAGGTAELAVQVSIPASNQAGDFDRGFLHIRRGSAPDRLYGAILTTGVERLAKPEPTGLIWQYWDGTRWAKLTVQDESDNFTRSGLLEFLPPTDLSGRELFGRTARWLRVTWDKGAYGVPPRLERMLLNTTLALQTTTLAKEVLGSSNGAESLHFRSTHSPVLAGQQLEVREPEMPSAEEQAELFEEEGTDAISATTDNSGRTREIWVRWHEVPDFYGSGPGDRHYVINHLTGDIQFGDGMNGRIPPRGTGNLRLARYQTGGGSSGNLAAGAIAQLKTTVPYVEKAANPDAAVGGAEAETTAALVDRMPRTLRHRDRAVTLEDYEDLALLASTEVARALCLPLCDLETDPLGTAPQPGVVSVIVVPRTGDVKPLPTLELLNRVGGFLGERAAATASVAVVGPLYIRVDVRAEVALTEPGGASTVEAAVYARLAAFLHPLTGGLDGSGWDFGRSPHRSDFFALIESVPGVDHVRYLQITEVEDQLGVRATGRFLVYSGEHQIALVFEET